MKIVSENNQFIDCSLTNSVMAYSVRIEPPYGNDAILNELAQVQSSIALLREKIAELEKRAAELIASLPRG